MPHKLAAYHAKRNFQTTPEPRGALAASVGGLRFVVQKHAASHLHYDFRLELDGTLKSWAIPKGPSLDSGVKRLAVHVEDHPLDYIDFEGDIPAQQYGAGHVEVWDTGNWQPIGDPHAGYRAGKLKFRLDGEKLHGMWTLVRTHMPIRGGGKDGGKSAKEQWLLIKEKDESARPSDEYDVVTAEPDSVLHREQQEGVPDRAVKAKLPAMMKPQLATLAEDIPARGEWRYELKFDGYRMLARLNDGHVKLFTREGRDWTAKLPKLEAALAALDVDDAWLDGEIVVLDKEGAPSFQLLQNAFDSGSTADIVYFLFDLPFCNGHDFSKVPLDERRARLLQLLATAPSNFLRFSATLHDAPQRLLAGACGMGVEGLIGKRAGSAYAAGKRSDTWIKLKCRQRQEFVIVGYTEPQGSRAHFGALLLGVFDDGRLRYAGRVGTGFDTRTLQSVYERLQPLQQEASALATKPPPQDARRVHWVKPELVAEISFAEWTSDGLLRQAVFHGLRRDKAAGNVNREAAAKASNGNGAEEAQVANVVITNPQRIIDGTIPARKLDLVRYYEGLAPGMLPYLKNRPVYLLRCPDGIGGEQFFQKHVTQSNIPGMRTLDPALDPGHAALMVIDDVKALIGAAQMDAVELHTCNATADHIDKPDCMVFDLDPDPTLPWARVIEGAKLTRVVLDELGLCSFIKTSGGKGLHVIVPLDRRQTWDEVSAFSQAVAQHMTKILPALFSAKMGAKNRVKKIFVDYLRNKKPASTVMPYSLRARAGLPIATPIAWDELDDVESAAQWTIANIGERFSTLKRDPWEEYFNSRQEITAEMKGKLGMKSSGA
jgi:bifunctional non-homologous end joining protein LigD